MVRYYLDYEDVSLRYGYDKDQITALAAITEAQKIAFAPMLFQAALNLRESGILAALDSSGKNGITLDEIENHCSLSRYAISILLDMGLSGHILYQQGKHFYLGKIGHYLLHDQMTRVNMDFTRDVCYQGLFSLKESLETGKPAGLSVFGEWPTIYPALSELPSAARESWFAFDHFYSDNAFQLALKTIFDLEPKHIYDIGANTGKWALQCVAYDPDVKITLLDLPQQIVLASENVKNKGYSDRISSYPVDLLLADKLPGEADVWWMSQFLDCFSEERIIHILKLIHRAMKPDSYVCIMEIFWDRQQFEAGAFSLNASSLYFTCMANGNSRFYHSDTFYQCLSAAGFYVEKDIDGLGIGHTLLVCRKESA